MDKPPDLLNIHSNKMHKRSAKTEFQNCKTGRCRFYGPLNFDVEISPGIIVYKWPDFVHNRSAKTEFRNSKSGGGHRYGPSLPHILPKCNNNCFKNQPIIKMTRLTNNDTSYFLAGTYLYFLSCKIL